VNGIFVAGTDTAVGKTRVAVALVRALVRDGLDVAAMKPVAAGAEPTPEGLRNDDALALMRVANVPAPYARVNPYCAKLAASPHIALCGESISVDTAVIRQQFDLLAAEADFVVVEGAGGWYAPLDPLHTMADVARALELPVMLVVGLRLGCLSHARLTFEAVERQGLTLAGWVANHVQPHFEHASENIATLQRTLACPLLDIVPFNGQGFEAPASIASARAALRTG
jgi:dethiobiotin synthetase